MGALLAAANVTEYDDDPVVNDCLGLVTDFLKFDYTICTINWNNDPERTQDEVVKAFRDTAEAKCKVTV